MEHRDNTDQTGSATAATSSAAVPMDSARVPVTSFHAVLPPQPQPEAQSPEPEQQLLSQIAQGDTSIFWQLWEQYQAHLYRCCLMWMGGNREDAEDALSSAALRAFQRLPRHATNITNLRAWFTRLTHNLCIDLQRERKRHTRYMRTATDMQAIPGKDFGGIRERPEEITLQRELNGYLCSTLADLPPALRNPSLLRFLHEWPYQDIAEYLTLSPENARKRIQQARVTLQSQLQGYLSGKTNGAGTRVSPSAARLASEKEAALTLDLRPHAKEMEIHNRTTVMRVTHFVLPSGIEQSCYFFLENEPARPHLKVHTLRAYVAQHPRGWKKRVALADLLYATGQWESALNEYQRVLERQPRAMDIWLRLGYMLSVLEKQTEATSVYEQALALAYTKATRCHLSGLIAMAQKKTDHALTAFAEAAHLEAHNTAHWNALGQAYQLARPAQWSRQALAAFRTALQLNPDDIVALTQGYEALIEEGADQEAQRWVARVLACDPHHVLALTRLANHRSRNGLVWEKDGKHTRQLIRKALKLAPAAVEPQVSLAVYHAARGKHDTAASVLQTFTEQHPNAPYGWYHLAHRFLQTGDQQAAGEAIAKAAALSPHDDEIVQAKSQICG